MDSRKLEIIMEMMEELQEEMQLGESDLSERLGRPKPEMAAVKLEVEGEPLMEEGDEDLEIMDEESPDEKFKKRLLKLRGE